MLKYILILRWRGRGFVNTCGDKFCVLAGMGGVYSKHVEIHCVSSLAWDGFGQHMFRYFPGPRKNGVGLVKAC